MLKKSNKGMQCRKRVDLQKGHLARAAAIAVNQMLQESQAEAVSLETPRQEQWRRKQAKLAELLAEESFLMKRQIAENEAERLKVEEMVAKAKARAKIYEESDSEDGNPFLQKEEARSSKQTDIDHYFQRGSNQKLIQDEHLHPKKTEIAEELCNVVKQQSAPDVDLDVFDRNLLEYHYFMTLFLELVEKTIEDPTGRLTRSIKYTKGDPK